MTSFARPILLTVALVATACQTKTPPPAASSEPTAEQKQAHALKSSEHRWQRMKDCAEQADRAARRDKLYEGAPLFGGYHSTGYTNHYSPKYERCYVAVGYFSRAALTQTVRDGKKKEPMSLDHLYDAYEGKMVAQCSSAEEGAYTVCIIDGQPSTSDCALCNAFISDHMNN
jgi:hypothetical protein